MDKKQLVGEVSLTDILDRLSFSEEDTPNAALEQPKLYAAAASYRIKKMRDRQEAELALDELRTTYSLKFRGKYRGEKGYTEKYLSDLVEHQQAVRDALRKAAETKRNEEWAKHLLDAYEHRRTSLKILTQFAFMGDSFSGSQREVEKLQNRKDALRRQRMVDDEE